MSSPNYKSQQDKPRAGPASTSSATRPCKRMVNLSIPLIAFLAAIIARVINNMEILKNVPELPSYQKTQEQCRPVGDTPKLAPSCEDFRFVSENIILTGDGAVTETIFQKGAGSPHAKTMVAIDLTTEKLRNIELEGYPFDEQEFRPHGLEYKAPNRFFVLSHSKGGVDRIEVFEISGQESLDTLKLKWITAVSPPVPAFSLNSVTAVSANEIYVSQWLPAAVPQNGLDNPKSFQEVLNVIYGYLMLLGPRMLGTPFLGFGATGVHRCIVDKNTCELVASKFVSANGITSSPDGKFVFVVDCTHQFLAVFRREASTGALTPIKAIALLHNPDNVMLKPLSNGKYELWIGSMPDFNRYLLKRKPIPGGLLTATFDPKDLSLTIKDEFIHDGRKLDAVATGAKWRNKILLSGPKQHGGILMCDANA